MFNSRCRRINTQVSPWTNVITRYAREILESGVGVLIVSHFTKLLPKLTKNPNFLDDKMTAWMWFWFQGSRLEVLHSPRGLWSTCVREDVVLLVRRDNGNWFQLWYPIAMPAISCPLFICDVGFKYSQSASSTFTAFRCWIAIPAGWSF